MKRNWLRLATIWFASFCFCVIGLGLVLGLPQVLLIEVQPLQTQGVVTGFPPDTHGLLSVRYQVAGSTFENQMRGTRNRYAIGDFVPIYYWAHDPATAVIGPPHTLFGQAIPFWFVASFGGSFAIAAVAIRIWELRGPFRRSWMFKS